MTAQFTLFSEITPKPEGLTYQSGFLSPAEEQALIGHIRALPFEPFQFGNYQGKRRVVYYGARYDFAHQRLEKAAPVPVWLVPYVRRTEQFAKLPAGNI